MIEPLGRVLDYVIDPSPEWRDRAVCRTIMDLDVFFPPQGGNAAVNAAKEICKTCPVIVECREYAMRNDIKHGVWGGLSELERRRLRRGTRVLRICRQCEGEFSAPRKAGGGPLLCSDACKEQARVDTWQAYNAKVRERRGIAS